ncbi:MAG: hypothetical protein IMF01_09340 [Proteobacteria bacterium]|nr:hypothetical protein [Pseudomonadota bacterium]
MFKIDSDGATVDNKFTEGDPALSVAATVVSNEWLNDVQGSLVNTIEAAGITLVKGDDDQLLNAIIALIGSGGAVSPLSQSLLNNTGPADITGFLMNKSTSVSKIAYYSIERKTATQNVQETGMVICTYDSADLLWHQSSMSVLDDSGVIFSIDNTDTDAAQLEYTTDDLTGASYVGKITMTSIIEIKL